MPEKNALEINKISKIIGALLLLQMFTGIWLNFFFYKPIFASPVDISDERMHFLTGIGVLLAIFLSAINFIICLMSRPLLNGKFQNHFICALSFAAIALALTALESNRLSELTNWIIYANNLAPDSLNSTGAQSAVAGHIRQILATGRNETHYMAIFISSLSILMFYSLLLRARLLPKPLMYFAVTACSLQVLAVGHAQFGLSIPVLLQLPLAINQLALPIYLIIRGFNQQQQQVQGANV